MKPKKFSVTRVGSGRTAARRGSAASSNGPRKARASAVVASAETDTFYIVSPSTAEERGTLVLKQDDLFGVFDHFGDIAISSRSEEGLYWQDTRFLSQLLLRFYGHRPLFLSSTVKEDNALLVADLTNPDLHSPQGDIALQRGTLHMFRSKLLWQDACYERLKLHNFGNKSLTASFSYQFNADYADIFEVRGTHRKRRGKMLKPLLDATSVVLGYQGLDGVRRHSRLEFSPAPNKVAAHEAFFDILLGPGEEATCFLTISAEMGEAVRNRPAYARAAELVTAEYQTPRERAARITSSNELFNNWLRRSEDDLRMLIAHTPYGPYPYAGVPWFSTPFGRDGLLTAMECLMLDPAWAKGVLAYLASTQARDLDPQRDAEPGKILHESRQGEMAALGEVPFGRYYGSIDSTPLFIMLAGAYYFHTANREFVASIWPNVEAALAWIDTYGDVDRDGFVEYARHSEKGLQQQGWKDSSDSIFHADGTLAAAPIALCEVQGYVYAAKRAAAELAAALERPQQAGQLAQQADALRQQFEEAFWCEDLSTYALALDGEKRPCRVRASNAGQCLMTGIARPDRAARVAGTLLADDSFSGFGIRTLSAGQARYNPMSYHNGSVWPHDNAIIAAGMARYGLMDGVLKVMSGMFDAGIFVDLHRMPELFCGFAQRREEGPTLYPVACAPQAWAAAAVYSLLQSCLGLTVDAPARKLRFSKPSLPESIDQVNVENLRVGTARVDFTAQRYDQRAAINVLHREGDVEVSVIE